MRVLVLGSGGREHALAWKISQSPLCESLLAAPGSAAIGELAECHPDVSVGDFDAIEALAERERIDLVVVGPEDPLAAGIVDRLNARGIAAFGPCEAAARLEGSKAWAKDFMERHRIPTAAHRSFDELDVAIAYVRDQGGRCVVKADGLAAGKGVSMCETPDAAEAALRETMGDRRFGAAGERVVIEEWMDGEEVSFYVLIDGERIVTLGAAQDHKRALDGDRGENTGGMGAYSPAPVFDPTVRKRVLEEIVHPVVRGMIADGHPFRGVLFCGLMIESDGTPRVVEFNVRFGDPETQALMVRMEEDLLPLLDGAARGTLPDGADVALGDPAVCVVMASGGYPRGYEKGKPISGLDAAGEVAGVTVFHAGTRRGGDGSGFETSGGRVLGVTASGPSVEEAVRRAYRAVDAIDFEGAQSRRDIAGRALARGSAS